MKVSDIVKERPLSTIAPDKTVQEAIRILNELNIGAQAKTGYDVSPAGEWLLDNFHLVEEQIRTAKRHLPKGYSRELPRLASGHGAGLPRAYVLASEASNGDDISISLMHAAKWYPDYPSDSSAAGL